MLCALGAKGFVGKHLCAYLDKKAIPHADFDLVDGFDIRNKFQLDKFFEENNITEVINLAALAGVRMGEEYPDEYISTNIQGTLNVARMCEKHNIQHLIHYSSSSVYGDTTPPIEESFVKKPKSIYGITKIASEFIIQSCNIKQSTILIPFTIYGGTVKEGCRKDAVIHKWISQIKAQKPITVYGNGKSQRGYVYIDDIVDITYRILTECHGHWAHETFNIGGSEVISLEAMVDMFKDNVKDLKIEEMNMPKADIFKNYADTSKIAKVLGWYPAPEFERNLKKILRKEGL